MSFVAHCWLRHCLAGWVFLTAGCGGSSTPVWVGAPTGATAALGPGDVFEVRVFEEPELSGVHRVGSDGSISFPLVGRLEVQGQDAQDIGQLLTERLRVYLKQPHVSILVKEYNSKKIFVLGQVKKPGTFPYEDHMNIIQAITLAGGFDKLANQNGTYVTRLLEGKEQRMQVAVKEIGEGKAPNFVLEPGDIVYVPESLF